MNHLTDKGSNSQPTTDSSTEEPAHSSEPASDSPVDAQVVIGIRIREASRIYHFAAPRGQVYPGDYVVVDRARGDQLARVVTVPDDDDASSSIPRDVRPIVRLADSDDRERAQQQAQRADHILQDMRSSAVRQDLGLYPVAIELNLDGDQGTAWFQAPQHVDFRPLLDDVKDKHDVRLNMQQANQRERAQLVDGYDICGLRLCCSSWMTDFPHVGIRVAKDQDLSLNPDSISGVCGRLLCCLTFEHEVYREMRGSLPRVGKRVSTPAGMGKVIKLNVLQQKVTIVLDDHPQRVDVPADQIGLAVRTEDAPNQALAQAEQARREADAQAAALRMAAAPATSTEQPASSASDTSASSPAERPPRRRRRRSRNSQTQSQQPTEQQRQQQPREQRPAVQPEQTGDEQAETAAKRPSRRRRRKPKVVNQQADSTAAEAAAPLQRPDGDSRPPRRRRRRSRQPVNQPDQSGDPSE